MTLEIPRPRLGEEWMDYAKRCVEYCEDIQNSPKDCPSCGSQIRDARLVSPWLRIPCSDRWHSYCQHGYSNEYVCKELSSGGAVHTLKEATDGR